MENSSKKSGLRGKVASVFLAVWVVMMIGTVAGPVALAAEPVAPANPSTLLPLPIDENGGTPAADVCETWFLEYTKEEFQQYWVQGKVWGQNTVLGCAIKTGRISLWMVPYFMKYIIEFVLYIGGLVAVAGILFGGVTYVFSGVSASGKENGKKAILYSVIGMVLMYMAWAIVNIVISLLTG